MIGGFLKVSGFVEGIGRLKPVFQVVRIRGRKPPRVFDIAPDRGVPPLLLLGLSERKERMPGEGEHNENPQRHSLQRMSHANYV
jgi:hypothetical protein